MEGSRKRRNSSGASGVADGDTGPRLMSWNLDARRQLEKILSYMIPGMNWNILPRSWHPVRYPASRGGLAPTHPYSPSDCAAKTTHVLTKLLFEVDGGSIQILDGDNDCLGFKQNGDSRRLFRTALVRVVGLNR